MKAAAHRKAFGVCKAPRGPEWGHSETQVGPWPCRGGALAGPLKSFRNGVTTSLLKHDDDGGDDQVDVGDDGTELQHPKSPCKPMRCRP